MRTLLKQILRKLVIFIWWLFPLAKRQEMAIRLGRQAWLPGYSWLAMMLIRDLAESDANAYNRFLWAHHLGFAAQYEKANAFGPENLTPTRDMLFEHLEEILKRRGIDPETGIRSVFEVGCSSGFLLYHLETELLTNATDIQGIDIDCQAIEAGKNYLTQNNSKVRISCVDMVDLDHYLGSECYDLLICAGVLMYLDQSEAAKVVCSMLRHTRKLVVITGRAHPEHDNREMTASVMRDDGTLIHNLDAMVQQAGGVVDFRRWEGSRLYGGYSVYFLFCHPGEQLGIPVTEEPFATSAAEIG